MRRHFRLNRIYKVAFLAGLVVVAGGIAFLAAWNVPAPVNKIEKVIPNDRFPR